MSLGASGDSKAQVLAATDIVELIGQSVALKRRGKDYVGLCPFHQEKTPSFHVSPGKQFFHCYGCKAGGNAIDFVIKRDRVDFLDALRVLADRAGIELSRGGADKQKAGERQMLFDAQSAACGLFENWLNHAEIGRGAREYLAKRGFNDQTIKQFRIGLAVESWDALSKSPAMRKYPPAILATAGLVKPRQKGEGFYDTFRNRVMFPIFEEAQARIIAFGGRVMPGSEDPAKYLNSPETPLFSKSRSVYGLNFARQRMIETETAVIVEGYTDVVMAHQYGATNVVSILGTAMTEHHVNLLRRFAKKIVLLFDADEAGDTAVDRSVELFLTRDVEIAIASMPEGVDPDEYVMQHGAAGFDKLIAGASDVLSYKWDQMFRRFQDASDDLTGQQKAVETYLELLAAARQAGPVDQMRWGAVLARVSRLTGIPIEDLHGRFRKRMMTKPAAPPAQTAAPAEAGAPAAQTTQRPEPKAKIPLARALAEREMLGILLREPQRWHKVGQVVHPADFTDIDRRKLAEIYWQHQQDLGEPVFSEFLGQLDEPAVKETALELMELAEALSNTQETLRGALAFFEEERRRREEQKQLAELRRISQNSAGSPDVEAKWAEFVKNNQTSDLRRLGPVRRFKSGS
jgi:DNA primase